MISFSIREPQPGPGSSAPRKALSSKDFLGAQPAEDRFKPAAENPFLPPNSASSRGAGLSLLEPARTARQDNPFRPSADKASRGLEFPLSPQSSPKQQPKSKPSSGFFPEGVQLGGGSEGVPSTNPGASSPAPLTLSSLRAAQSAALAALPAGANAAFAYLFQVLDGSRFAKEQLVQLLDKGALAPKKAQPSVLETLRDLTDKPRVGGVDGAELTRETLTALNNPDESVFQGKSYTCSVANLERQLAGDPLAFARVVEGLSSPRGQAILPTGDILQRADGSLKEDGSGRNGTDRLIQGAFMSMANGKGAYNPETDRFENDAVPGLKPLEIARVTAAVEGKDQVVVIHDGGTHQEFERLVRTHGTHDSFQLGVSWQGTDHMLLLTRVEGDTAHFFNPATRSGNSMPLRDLLFKTQFALLAGDQVDSQTLPEDAQYWFRREASPANQA